MAGLLLRIMISGFKLDWTLISPVYCKLRWYGLQFGVLTSFACTCLAAIDQYMCTNARLEWGQWSTADVAHRLIIIMTITCLLHGVPYLIYFNLVRAPIAGEISCTSDNLAFRQYHTYGYLIILADAPLIMTCIFGLLAHNNVHQLAHRTLCILQGPFYIYTCTSERFCQQIIYVLLNVHLKRWQQPIIQTNQLVPTSHENP
ncbi:unnamed protein product [Rotaria magnacalcarata]